MRVGVHVADAAKIALQRAYLAGAKLYLTPLLKHEWKRSGGAPGEQTTDWEFALRAVNLCGPREVLDVGTGATSWPHLLASAGLAVTAIDKVEGYWTGGLFNRHFYVLRDDVTRTRLGREFDLVTCMSTLQHVPAADAAVTGVFDLTKPGGHLVLTFPYNERRYVEDVYSLPGSSYGRAFPFGCHVFSREQLDGWLTRSGGELVAQEYYRVFTGELWSFGERLFPPRHVGVDELHQRTAVLIRKARQ